MALREGRHLVLAPPGSGKTEMLALRLRAAIAAGSSLDSMLCVTFTNRAARNMRERFGDYPGEPPFIGTLHTFGLRFLFSNQLIPANTILLDEEDAEQALSDAIRSVVEDSKVAFVPKLQDVSGYIRLRGQKLLHLGQTACTPSPDALSERIAVRYEQIKSASCAIDFDDILHLMLGSLLHKAPTQMQSYRWLQVDEVQDLSELQWSIVTRLIAEDAHVVYFGDYDQAIFSFMGASHAALTQFTKGSTVHHLDENYRSAPKLIAVFNAYATANLPSRKEPRLQPGADGKRTGGSIEIRRVKGTFENEAQSIATAIVPDLIRVHAPTAVLTRSNADADAVSKNLSDREIEHFKVSGYDLFGSSAEFVG